MVKRKIIVSILIFASVSIVAWITNQPWLAVLYSTILSLYANEIKDFFNGYILHKQIRITCSYLFRIELGGRYFLIKDEHGSNKYRPVGGVYKYNREEIDLFERFGATYDGYHDADEDVDCDLRIVLPWRAYKKFFDWFASNRARECISNVSREFVEELIHTGVVDAQAFDHLSYTYTGSYLEKSKNESLHLQQYRRYDIITLVMDKPQRECFNALMSKRSDDYVFAINTQIKEGSVVDGVKRYEIEAYTQLLTERSLLSPMDGMATGESYKLKVEVEKEVVVAN